MIYTNSIVAIADYFVELLKAFSPYAWPCFALIFVCIFKNEIKNRLLHFSSAKIAGNEIEFSKDPEADLKFIAKDLKTEKTGVKKEKDANSDEQLSGIILNSWKDIEIELDNETKKYQNNSLYPNVDLFSGASIYPKLNLIKPFGYKNYLGPNMPEELQESYAKLRKIRNLVVHSNAHGLKLSDAIEYKALAEDFLKSFKKHRSMYS